MPGWLKALLIVVVVIVLLVVGVIGAGVFWWMRNKDALISKGKAIATEAHDFGRRTDNQGCVNETLSRYKADRSFTNGISMGIFMRICLDNSKPTPGFCDDVPGRTEFIKIGQWEAEQCRAADLASDSYCPQLFAQVQQFCVQPYRLKGNDNANNH